MPLEVRFKRLHKDAGLPQYATDGSAAFDLASIEDISLDELKSSGTPVLYRTGLVIAAPADHMLFITHRSSTPQRWGITVTNGIVDEDYCGDEDEIRLQVIYLCRGYSDMANGDGYIPAGTRIAQGIFIPISRTQFIETKWMGQSRGGWGSTG